MSIKPIVDHVFSSPQFAPYYQSPPKRYQGCRMINVLFRTMPETQRALVPAPLLPAHPSLMYVYVGYFNVVAPQSYDYLEAGIGVPVLFNDTPGHFNVVLFLDNAPAVAAGREIYGFPKKYAEITFNEQEDGITARVIEQNVTLIDITFHRSERIIPIPKEESEPSFNLKLIPSLKKDAPPDVMQLTSMLFEDAVTKDLQKGSATLKFSSSSANPLGDLSVVEILDGSYSSGDFTLGFGEVVYDYLHES